MRKNKGYQRDFSRTYGHSNSFARGTNKTLEQYVADINAKFDRRVEVCKREYARISNKTTLVGEALRKYCRDWMLWEVQFDDQMNLVPLEDALARIEENRRRCVDRNKYSKWGAYQKRIINKDNQKFCYNSSTSAGNCSRQRIRVPSLKRSVATWRRFYELFPELKGMKTYRGIKLKQI